MFADIIVKTKIPSIGKVYTYAIPEELANLAMPGKTVVVPFGKKNLEGIILRVHKKEPEFSVKEVTQISPETSLLSERSLHIGLWMSIRYSANFFDCISSLIPKETGKLSGKVEKISQTLEAALTLTPEQEDVFTHITRIIDKEVNKKMLLHGVTGSGKTEIYLHLAANILKQDKQVLFMVPEISLTPQLIDRFAKRFGKDQIAIVHSHITQSKRSIAWEEIRAGRKKVIIGSRSAILSPFKDLGVVIIDECHEQSYKQDKNPKYNAIDLGIFLSETYGIPLLLGSATPLIEQYYLAEINDFHLLELTKRISGQFPKSMIIDLKDKAKNNYSIISKPLIGEVISALTKNEQVLFYLNRRGVRSSLICTSCGHTESCPNCSMPLTVHSNKRGLTMVCHYCYFTKPLVQQCSACGSKMLKGLGHGTQSILEEARGLFPGHPILVMDKDTTEKKGSHETIFHSFSKKEADILIGTQMITKGWDISNVSLTGYLLLDSDLLFPSFRTSERVYQLITQFSGRAGRGNTPGLSIIQTYNPQNPILQDAIKNDYKDFYKKELEMRRRLLYPPFADLIQIVSKDKNERKALDKLKKFVSALKEELKDELVKGDIILLGPSRCFISKMNNDYFMQYTIKLPRVETAHTDIDIHALEGTLHTQTEEIYTGIAKKNPSLSTITRVLNKISRQEGISVNIDPFELS